MTRYRWQGSGTIETGGSGQGAVLLVAVAAGAAVLLAVLAWLSRHFWQIAGIAAALLVFAAAGLYAAWRLTSKGRAADRAEIAAAGARWHAAVQAETKPQVMQAAPPAIEYHVHHHTHMAPAEPARVVRQIPDLAGKPLTEETPWN